MLSLRYNAMPGLPTPGNLIVAVIIKKIYHLLWNTHYIEVCIDEALLHSHKAACIVMLLVALILIRGIKNQDFIESGDIQYRKRHHHKEHVHKVTSFLPRI